jgi:hypothetical protein
VNRRTLAMGAALTLVLLAAAGCGRRGALEAPAGATVAPRPAASERLVAPVAQVTAPDAGDLDNDFSAPNARARTGQTRPVAVAPAPVDPNRPNKSFFLDPLVK